MQTTSNLPCFKVLVFADSMVQQAGLGSMSGNAMCHRGTQLRVGPMHEGVLNERIGQFAQQEG
jgi:hypothetical protein